MGLDSVSFFAGYNGSSRWPLEVSMLMIRCMCVFNDVGFIIRLERKAFDRLIFYKPVESFA